MSAADLNALQMDLTGGCALKRAVDLRTSDGCGCRMTAESVLYGRPPVAVSVLYGSDGRTAAAVTSLRTMVLTDGRLRL